MFQAIEEKLDKVTKQLEKTNELLSKIEENLRVPNLVQWSEYRKSMDYCKKIYESKV